MKQWIKQLDGILRGEATRLEALREARIEVSARGLSLVLLVLGMIYGICMACFALMRPDGEGWKQLSANLIKFPALFFLTLLVTFPSLYVFNALVGSRLTLLSLARLLIAAMGVMLAVAASFGTIVAFFSFTTTSYSFMVLLNVIICGAAGALGLGFLLQTLHRITVAMRELPPATPLAPSEAAASSKDAGEDADPGALEPLPERTVSRQVKTVFKVWVIVFALVGAQMSWVLRPFIGSPLEPFSFFRPRGSNFFQAVLHVVGNLLGI